MSLVTLFNELEEMVDKASNVPFSDKSLISKEKLLDTIDEIRLNLPNEMREAKMVMKEREEILAEAREEANGILLEAQEQVKEMAEENEVVQYAKEQSQLILEEAQSIALDIRQGADEYAATVLSQLELQLGRALSTVQNGQQQLRVRNNELPQEA